MGTMRRDSMMHAFLHNARNRGLLAGLMELSVTVRRLLELIRFSHTLFALPFALFAALMAWTANAHVRPPVAWRWRELLAILLCMVTARSAAMTFNRIVDRDVDGKNPRTAARHLPAGLVGLRQAVAFAVLASLVFFAATLLFLPNVLPVVLSVPVLGVLFGYSYSKRFASWSHFWLGAALMLAPISTWIALRGQAVWADPLDLLPATVLGLAVMGWVAGFDIIYACQDNAFDREHRLYSIPARWGIAAALRIAAVCHGLALALFALLPVVFPFLGWIYWCGVAAVGALLVYEHALVRPHDLTHVNVAFFRVNAVISLGLLAVGAIDLYVT